MSDWRPKLIASDMDGTLLRWDDTVSDATVAELERWRAEGVPVVLATGRPPRWMRRIRDVLRYGTAVCCNGAVLMDLERFEIIDEDALMPDVLESVTTELRRRQAGIWFAVEYGLEFRHEPIYKPRWDADVPGVAEATLAEMVAQPVAKLLARHEDLPRDEFVALVEDVVAGRATVTNSSGDEGVRPGEGGRPARHRPGGRRRLRGHAQRHRRVRLGPCRRRPGGGHGRRAPRPPGGRHRRHRQQRGRRSGRVPRRALSGFPAQCRRGCAEGQATARPVPMSGE
jgi:hypothetical protein